MRAASRSISGDLVCRSSSAPATLPLRDVTWDGSGLVACSRNWERFWGAQMLVSGGTANVHGNNPLWYCLLT